MNKRMLRLSENKWTKIQHIETGTKYYEQYINPIFNLKMK